jgi:hypothetical protein
MGQGASGATQGLTGIAATAGGPWGAAIAGAANIGLSLAEASSQKELATAADRTAKQAAAEQKRLLSQNYFDALQVPMQAYDKAFRETTAQQQQAMSALQEGDPRLLLGGVGKVQAVAGDQEAATRDALAQQLFDIQKTQAIAGTNVNQNLSILEGNRLSGAQKAAAAAKAAEVQQQQAAIKAGGGLVTGLLGIIGDYNNQGEDAGTAGDMSQALTPAGTTNTDIQSQLQGSTSNALPSSVYAPNQNPYGGSYGLTVPGIQSQLLNSVQSTPQQLQNQYAWLSQLGNFGK